MKAEAILLVRPRDAAKTPFAWPDQDVVMRVQRLRKPLAYMLLGYTTIAEYTSETVVRLDRALIMGLMGQWRQMYGRGMWDFLLKPEGHYPTLFDSRRKKIHFIQEGP